MRHRWKLRFEMRGRQARREAISVIEHTPHFSFPSSKTTVFKIQKIYFCYTAFFGDKNGKHYGKNTSLIFLQIFILKSPHPPFFMTSTNNAELE